MESATQRIIDQILRDAREEAKSIVKEAQRSAEALLGNQRQSARQRAEEDVYSLLKRAESEAETVRGRVIADTKRKAGWMVLSEKERLVTSVLDEVKTRLEALSQSEKYIPILEKLIVDAGTALGGGKLKALLNKRDSALALKLNILAKAIAKRTGTKTQLKLCKEKIETSGGAIVKTLDGRIVVDNTFEAILKRRERELRLKIARILFRN